MVEGNNHNVVPHCYLLAEQTIKLMAAEVAVQDRLGNLGRHPLCRFGTKVVNIVNYASNMIALPTSIFSNFTKVAENSPRFFKSLFRV